MKKFMREVWAARPWRPGRKGLRYPNGIPRTSTAHPDVNEAISAGIRLAEIFELPPDPFDPADWFISPIGSAYLADAWDDKYAEFLDAIELDGWVLSGEDAYGNPVYVKRLER